MKSWVIALVPGNFRETAYSHFDELLSAIDVAARIGARARRLRRRGADRRRNARTIEADFRHSATISRDELRRVEIEVFRIAQEALNNVAKHAGARRVEIALDYANGECVMTVQDDGIGFRGVGDSPDKPNPGLGMVTMRERSQAVGGRFEIRALPAARTRLTVRIPY